MRLADNCLVGGLPGLVSLIERESSNPNDNCEEYQL